MIGSIKIKAFGAILLTMAFFANCYDSPDVKDVKEVAAELDGTKIEINEKDAKAIENTYAEGLLEMRLADTAKAHATFNETKKLAMAISDLHSDLNAQLVNLAGRRSVVLPGDILPEQLQLLNKMSAIKGASFDKTYIDTTVARHKANVALYKEYIKNCVDSELVACFKTVVPLFQKHLSLANVSGNNK